MGTSSRSSTRNELQNFSFFGMENGKENGMGKDERIRE
jgi:hypothetical protein